MRSNKQWIIGVCVSMILSFLYGVITVQYKIPPLDQLRAIKQIVNPSPSPSPIASLNPSPSPSYSDYYYHKKSFFEQFEDHQYDIVFIGDSLTDGAEWGDLFPSLKIANRGINGDRTDGVLKRMDSIYSTNGRKAFIMIGINDLTGGAEVNDIVENYKIIISNLVAHRIKTYVQSTLLLDKKCTELNKKIMTLNDHLKKMSVRNKSFTYIDVNAGLAKNTGLDTKYSRDGTHLNGSGYAVWKDIIKSYI